MKRPPQAVLDVCTEIERFNTDREGIEWAAAQMVALRKLVKDAMPWVAHDTTEQQRWHSEAARRTVKVRT